MTVDAFLKSLGADLQKTRIELHLKRGDVAQHLGVSEKSISNWECGKASMSVVTERRMQAYFRTVRAAKAAKLGHEGAQKAVTA